MVIGIPIFNYNLAIVFYLASYFGRATVSKHLVGPGGHSVLHILWQWSLQAFPKNFVTFFHCRFFAFLLDLHHNLCSTDVPLGSRWTPHGICIVHAALSNAGQEYCPKYSVHKERVNALNVIPRKGLSERYSLHLPSFGNLLPS